MTSSARASTGSAPGLGMLYDRPGTDVEIMGEAAYHREFTEHARLLAEAGVDVMLPSSST